MDKKVLKVVGSLIVFSILIYLWASGMKIPPFFALWGWALVLVIDLRAFFGI